MYEIIHWLSTHHAMEILLALGIVLVLVDYFFRTDVPAHFGYFCFACAFYFALGSRFTPLTGLFVALGGWILLEVFHRMLFSKFLTNAPGTERA